MQPEIKEAGRHYGQGVFITALGVVGSAFVLIVFLKRMATESGRQWLWAPAVSGSNPTALSRYAVRAVPLIALIVLVEYWCFY
jgi:hypothetical protein